MLYHDKCWLNEQYLVKKLSHNDIATLANTTNSVIRKWMKKFNIKSRTPSEGNLLKWHDQQYRSNAVKSIKIASNAPATRKKKQSISKKMWENQIFRCKMLRQWCNSSMLNFLLRGGGSNPALALYSIRDFPKYELLTTRPLAIKFL